MRSILGLALRAWLRYLVPLTFLSAITFGALEWFVVHAGSPTDLAQARSRLWLGWALVAAAPILQLALVAGVAPAVRAVARGTPLSQAGAFAVGARSLVRAIVPWSVAIAAIVLGGVALVVPGAVLFVLFAMTGASDRLGEPLPAPLADSVAAARARLSAIVVVVVAMLALDAAIALGAQLAVVHAMPAKPTTAALVAMRTFVRVVGITLVASSPVVASALAAVYVRSRTPRSLHAPR